MAKKPKLFTNTTIVCNKCGFKSEVPVGSSVASGCLCWNCNGGYLKPKGQHGTKTKS